jgi:hypothetical protein
MHLFQPSLHQLGPPVTAQVKEVKGEMNDLSRMFCSSPDIASPTHKCWSIHARSPGALPSPAYEISDPSPNSCFDKKRQASLLRGTARSLLFEELFQLLLHKRQLMEAPSGGMVAHPRGCVELGHLSLGGHGVYGD